MHTRGFQSVKGRGVLVHSWYAFLQSPHVLGANAYPDPGYLYKWSHTIEDNQTELAIAHRISADFRLRAHSIIRLQWCVDVQPIMNETLSHVVTQIPFRNHNIMNVESGKSLRQV